MFLVVGLGNPGNEYEKTRHNAGFLCIDHIANHHGFPTFVKKFKSFVSCVKINGIGVVLQKPQISMNLSGWAVLSAVSFFKICPESVFVIHDDIDLSFSDLRIKIGGGSGGHNGIRSIDSLIGKDYWRIRIGVGRPENKIDVVHYVISNFSATELSCGLADVFSFLSKNFSEILFSCKRSDIIQTFKNKSET